MSKTRSHSSRSGWTRSEEHTSELQSRLHLVCRLLLGKKKVKQASDEAQLEQGLGKEPHAREKTTPTDLFVLPLPPQHPDWHFDALAPPLTQLAEDKHA